MNPTTQHREATSPRYRAPALEKGLDILELLSDRPEGLSQTDIARTLDRSVGEIFRMLNCLVERGYLAIQRPGDRYILTLKLFELSHKNPPINRMLDQALPLMKELTHEVHQSCHLAVVEAGHGVVVAQVDNPGHIGFAVRVGSVMNLAISASGRVLLAFQSDEDRARILARDESVPAADSESERMLETIRNRGYEEMESTRIRGVHDISFPVLNHRGAAVAAMTIPFIERLDLPVDPSLAAARQALGRSAARLSTLLGGKPLARWSEPQAAKSPRKK